MDAGLNIEKQVPLPIVYRDVKLDCGYRIDILVERKVILELKSVGAFTPVHLAQVLTYLKLSNPRLGLLLNFQCSSN